MRTTRKIGRSIARLLCGTAVIVLVEASQAAPPSPAQRCQAAKLLAAGAEARAALFCARNGLATGTDAGCLAASRQRRDAAFSRAEARGGCTTTGDSPDIAMETDALLDTLLAALRPAGPGASSCTRAQLGAAARTIAKLTQAYARDKRAPDAARLAARLDAARAEFEAAFARTAAKADCLSTTTAEDAFAIIAEAATRLRGKLCPMCGDGVKAPTEACDGSEIGQCPGSCAPDCTCAVPTPTPQPTPTPGATCPCWTAASLAATFPPGYFDVDGRGGAMCTSDPESLVAVGAADTCFLPQPGGPGFNLTRAGAAVVEQTFCTVFADLDPGDDGFCDGPPTVVSITSAQAAACIQALLDSQIFLECS